MGSIDFKVLPELKLVWFRGSGDIPFEEIIHQTTLVFMSNEFSTTFSTFFDFGEASIFFEPHKVEEHSELIYRIKSIENSRKWAIHSQDAQTHETANFFRVLMSGGNIDIRYFHMREEAFEWLGVEPLRHHPG